MKHQEIVIDGVQIQTDGTTVWINGPDGMNLGRFGKVGVDVHHGTQGQIEGKHCIDCFKRSDVTWTDWQRFTDSIYRTHGIVIPMRFRPVH